jgi:hypothetical protein
MERARKMLINMFIECENKIMDIELEMKHPLNVNISYTEEIIALNELSETITIMIEQRGD